MMNSPHMAVEPEAWHLIVKTQDYALASWQQIFAVIWRRDTTVEGGEHLRSACTAFARTQPRGIGLLTVVESGAPLPPGPARRAIADFLAEGSAFIKCSAVVFEGSGFRAAAVRSVVTGLTLMARQAYPHRVCDIEDAIEMFVRILPGATDRPVNAAAFRSTLAALRKTIDAS
jgi:hypothetical protein